MPKRKAKNVPADPILQDSNITSATNIETQVSCPSNTACEQNTDSNEVLNQNPSGSQMHKLDEESQVTDSPTVPFKMPFSKKNARHYRPSLFDSVLNESESNTPESTAVSKPFKRTCRDREISFSISSANESINDSISARRETKFARKQKTGSKVQDHIFDSDLDESGNKSKASCGANSSFQVQTHKSTIANYKGKRLAVDNSGIFESDLDSELSESVNKSKASCGANSTFQVQTRKSTIANYKGKRLAVNNSGIFESDLDSDLSESMNKSKVSCGANSTFQVQTNKSTIANYKGKRFAVDNSGIFESDLESDLSESVNKSKASCGANSTFQVQTRISTIANYKGKRLATDNSGIFESDLESSNNTSNVSKLGSIREENDANIEKITTAKRDVKISALPFTKAKNTLRQDLTNNTFDSIFNESSNDVSECDPFQQSTPATKELLSTELKNSVDNQADNLSTCNLPRLPFVKTRNRPDKVNEDIFQSDLEGSDISLLHTSELNFKPPFLKASKNLKIGNSGMFDSDLEASNTTLHCIIRDESQYDKTINELEAKECDSNMLEETLVAHITPGSSGIMQDSIKDSMNIYSKTIDEKEPNNIPKPTDAIDISNRSENENQLIMEHLEATRPNNSQASGTFETRSQLTVNYASSIDGEKSPLENMINTDIPKSKKSAKRVSFRPSSSELQDSLSPLVYDSSFKDLNQDSVYIDMHPSRSRNSGSSANSISENNLLNSNNNNSSVVNESSTKNIQITEHSKIDESESENDEYSTTCVGVGEGTKDEGNNESNHMTPDDNYKNVSDSNSEYGEESVPADSNSEDVEESVPADGNTDYDEESVPEDGNSENAEESVPAEGNTEYGEESVPEDGDSEYAEESVSEDGDSEYAEESVPADGNTEYAEESVPADGNTEYAEESVLADGNSEYGEESSFRIQSPKKTQEGGSHNNRSMRNFSKRKTSRQKLQEPEIGTRNKNVHEDYESFLRDTHDKENQLSNAAQATSQAQTNKVVFKKPHLKKLSKSRITNILDNLPYSELKKRPAAEYNREQTMHNEIEESLRKRKKQQATVTKPHSGKLKKPRKWVSSSLYEFIINKLKPRYGVNSRVQAEKLVLYLVEQTDKVLKIRDLSYFSIVEEMKVKLASLQVVKTHFDFRQLIVKKFDGPFIFKAYPLAQNKPSNPFEPENIFEDIAID